MENRKELISLLISKKLDEMDVLFPLLTVIDKSRYAAALASIRTAIEVSLKDTDQDSIDHYLRLGIDIVKTKKQGEDLMNKIYEICNTSEIRATAKGYDEAQKNKHNN